MTQQELSRLTQRVEDLPDEIMKRLPDELIKRLDDRYVKKDNAPKQFITRIEGQAVAAILSLAVTLLTVINFIQGNKQ